MFKSSVSPERTEGHTASPSLVDPLLSSEENTQKEPIESEDPIKFDAQFKPSIKTKSKFIEGNMDGKFSINDEARSEPSSPEDGMPPGMEMTGIKRAESSEALNLTLHQCARDGNVENLERLLNQLSGNIRKKVNWHDDEWLSPLHYAARWNHYDVVVKLLEWGADPNDRGDEDATPLHYAARYRRERAKKKTDADVDTQDDDEVEEASETKSVVTYLVTKGAMINVPDKYGSSPLHFAAMRGNEVAARDLLMCNHIDIEDNDLQQMTPLHQAAIHGNVEVARMLVAANAKLTCFDEDHCTPLHHACSEGNVPIVTMLFEAGAKLDGWVTIAQMVTDQDSNGSTCLHYAVDNGHYEVSRICLEKGADVNIPRSHYMFPLHLAAVAGNIDIVKLLLQRGARIDVLNDSMETPLHRTAAYDYVEVVDYLVQNGARVNRRDKDGYTPLLIAASHGHHKTVTKLLELGADISVTEKSDRNAIYLAAEENNVAVLKVLLTHKRAAALLNSSDKYDNEPLHVAAMNGYLEILKCLLEKGADNDCKNEEEKTPLHLAAAYGRSNIVRELVRWDKTAVNDEDEDSNTPLHLAALHGHKKAAQALINIGADVEARNTFLWTPLDCAAAKGWDKTAKVLLEADSPVDPVDKSKTTPLHLACTFGHLGVVQLLMQWEANVSQRDTAGNNCLDLAIDNNRIDVAMAIISASRWEEALRNDTVDLNTLRRDTPMRKLIRKMPDVAEKVFHQCTTSNNKNTSLPDYRVTFNYEFLDDMYANWKDESEMTSSSGSIYEEDYSLKEDARPYTNDSGVLKKNHPLMIMVTTKREDLLNHPLVTTLLSHKWRKFGRVIYYMNLLLHVIFLAFLTTFVCVTKPYYIHAAKSNYTDCEMANSGGLEQDIGASIGKYIIIGLAVINLLREIFQIFQRKLGYFGFENLIEWITYVTAVLFVLDFTSCQRVTGWRTEWQWQVGAISVFLAWMDLLLFIRKFPRLGIYVVMFTDVLKTFAQFFIVFFLFIIAFALGFYALLQNQTPFDSVENSLLKTAVMMIGEFEYDAIFNSEVENDPTSIVNIQWLTRALFVTFLILMSIIIMNLLVGLAVDDIKAVQEQAVLKRYAMQVELALDVESIVPHFFRRKFVVKCEKVYPNQSGGRLSYASIAQALDPELDEIEVVQENQEKMREDIKRVQKAVRIMQESTSRLESMLSALLTQQGISWQEEDDVTEDPEQQ